jgi:hypothetical protein
MNCQDRHEWRIGKDLEEGGRDLIDEILTLDKKKRRIRGLGNTVHVFSFFFIGLENIYFRFYLKITIKKFFFQQELLSDCLSPQFKTFYEFNKTRIRLKREKGTMKNACQMVARS